jgi:predicted ArsR family transcriptional regulator
LADELGTSRNAVRRRLELFEARGIVESGWQRGGNPIRITKAVLASPQSDDRLRRLRQLIIDAGVALSKLEV